jgi:hypothetical protein
MLAILIRFIPLSTTILYNDCGEVAKYTIISFDNDPTYSKAAYNQLQSITSAAQPEIIDWCTPVGLGPSQARLYLF